MLPKSKQKSAPVPVTEPEVALSETAEVLDEAPAPADEPEFETPDGPKTVVIPGQDPILAVTTYNTAPPPPPPASEAPQVAHNGRPAQYMVIRSANQGWVIEERWQHFGSFEQIQELLDAEVAAGHSGTLFRGNTIVATWGPHGPVRV